MAAVTWTDDLSVGAPLIDEQHQMLMQRLNDLHAAIASHQGQSAITGTLGFLAEYADFHFNAEEKHMAAANYPGLDQQVAEHNEFRETLERIERDFIEDGATHELAATIDTLLIRWFVDHIRGMDLEFGAFLRDQGITLPNE